MNRIDFGYFYDWKPAKVSLQMVIDYVKPEQCIWSFRYFTFRWERNIASRIPPAKHLSPNSSASQFPTLSNSRRMHHFRYARWKFIPATTYARTQPNNSSQNFVYSTDSLENQEGGAMYISCEVPNGEAAVEPETGYVPNNPLFGLPLDSPQVKFN